MALEVRSRSILRFGAFEVDVRSGEVRKQGVRIKLQEQPFHVLTVLLQRPGEVVTRGELRNQNWPADTFVDLSRRCRDADIASSHPSPAIIGGSHLLRQRGGKLRSRWRRLLWRWLPSQVCCFGIQGTRAGLPRETQWCWRTSRTRRAIPCLTKR